MSRVGVIVFLKRSTSNIEAIVYIIRAHFVVLRRVVSSYRPSSRIAVSAVHSFVCLSLHVRSLYHSSRQALSRPWDFRGHQIQDFAGVRSYG